MFNWLRINVPSYYGAGRFFQGICCGTQLLNHFVTELLNFILESRSKKIARQRIIAANYYLMALMATEIEGLDSRRSKNQTPLHLVNFIASKYNEHRNGKGLRSMKLRDFKIEVMSDEERRRYRGVLVAFCCASFVITMMSVFGWSSYPMMWKVINISFIGMCFLRMVGVFSLVWWMYSIIFYSFIALFDDLSIAVQVLGILHLVSETVYLIIGLKMRQSLIYADALLPYIGDIQNLPFDTKFEGDINNGIDMIGNIDRLQHLMFDPLDQVQAVLDSDLFSQYRVIGEIIADYLKYTLPVFDGEHTESDIEDSIQNLVGHELSEDNWNIEVYVVHSTHERNESNDTANP